MLSTKASQKIFIFLISIFIFTNLFCKPAHAIENQARPVKYYYSVKKLDPVADESTTRRYFINREYSLWAEEAILDGETVLIVRREDTTLKNDKLSWQFYVNPRDLKLLKIERTIHNQKGEILDESTQYWGRQYPDGCQDCVHMEMLPVKLQRADLSPGTLSGFRFVMQNDFAPWPVNLQTLGEETITTPAGAFNCVRLTIKFSQDALPPIFKMLPSFILEKLIGNFDAWVQKDEPHAMVRLQGKFDGPAAPVKIEELIRIEK